MRFLNPTKTLQFEQQVIFQKIRSLLHFLNKNKNTYALSKMVKFPSARYHFWNMATSSGHHCDLGNMGTKIKHKCVKTCSQTDGRGDSQNYPIKWKFNEVFNCLNKINNTCSIRTWVISPQNITSMSMNIKFFISILPDHLTKSTNSNPNNYR